MMNSEDIRSKLRSLTKEELIEIVELMLPLVDRVAELEKEVERLKNQNSRNSSLPPSRDNQKIKKKTRSLRKKSGRKSGGQKGHPGHTLKMSEQIDEIIDYPVRICTHCNADLSERQGTLLERKQVLDIPPVQLKVTEHRRWTKACAQCGEWTSSQFGPELKSGPPVRYGDRIKNQLIYLHIRQLLPYQRLSETMEVLYNQKISEGTIANMLKSKAEQAADAYDQIIQHIEQSKVVGVDESGCSVRGDKSWIWTWVTKAYSLFYISENRGKKTSNLLFPRGFRKGTLTSDCWRTHLNTTAKNHQICIPHLRRECQGLIDFHRSAWAKKLDNVLNEILIECRKKRIHLKTKQRIENSLDEILASKLTNSHKSIRALKNRLIRLRNNITPCLYDRKIAPDNNASERAIRMIKLKTKISGTFRSWDGSHIFSVLRTIVDSAIKQSIHPFLAIQNPNIFLNPPE